MSFGATIPNSNWCLGAKPLDPTGGLTSPPRHPTGLIPPAQPEITGFAAVYHPPYLRMLATPLTPNSRYSK